MMKQFHRARISLRDMGKDYTVLTINQANKETLSLEKSSNIVAQTIEVNATNSISKLQTKNISNNIKTVKTVPFISIQNRCTKNKIRRFHVKSIEKVNGLSYEVINLTSSVLWGKKHWPFWRYWILMESFLTKKREGFWANFIYRGKGTLDSVRVGVMLTSMVLWGRTENKIILKVQSDPFVT